MTDWRILGRFALVGVIGGLSLFVAMPGTAGGANGDTILVSRADGADGEQTVHDAFVPAISANGVVVAFHTSANWLDPSAAGFGEGIFVRNIATDTTRLASRADGPTGAPGNGSTSPWGGPAISGNGRYVAFISSATNLDAADTDSVADVFVRDLEANTTTLVSRASGPAGAKANGDAGEVAISAGGRFVAFSSQASNLHQLDTDTIYDVFVRDLEENTTTLVSRATGPAGTKGDGHSHSPAISADGSQVSFVSAAGNLDPADGDFGFFGNDVYLRDIDGPTTTLISRASTAGGADGNGNSGGPSISADGSRVAFSSNSTNLDPLDTDSNGDVYVRDVAGAATALVSRSSAGPGSEKANAAAGGAAISGDGRLVAFASRATNLGQDANSISDVFTRNLDDGGVTLVSRPDGFGGFSDDDSHGASISGDGLRTAFTSRGDLHADDSDLNSLDVYVREGRENVGRRRPQPEITITRPSNAARLPRLPVRVSGQIDAPSGISRFCVVANADETAMPANCSQRGEVLPGGAFAGVEAIGARNGPNTITAWVRERSGATNSDTINVEVGAPDLEVISLDVTQGIQRYGAATAAAAGARHPGVTSPHRQATYAGLHLFSHKKTIVRMYTRVANGGCAANVTAALHGFGRLGRSPRALPGGALLPTEGTRRVCDVPLATQRATPSAPGTFTFVLPDSWREGRQSIKRNGDAVGIDLVGEVNPRSLAPRFADPRSGNDAFSLSGTVFQWARRLVINPVALVYPGGTGPSDPSNFGLGSSPGSGTFVKFDDPGSAASVDVNAIFGPFIQLAPLDVRVRPWRGLADISGAGREPTGERCSEVIWQLADWEDHFEVGDRGLALFEFDDAAGENLVIGIFDSGAYSGGCSQTSWTILGLDFQESVAVAHSDRPLTSVAHETGHQLALEHAGSKPSCYTGQEDQNPEDPWPNDNRGTINGWALDTREGTGSTPGSPATSGPYEVFGLPGPDFGGTTLPPGAEPVWVDFMSYCVNQGDQIANYDDPLPGSAVNNAWISKRYWERLSNYHVFERPVAANASGHAAAQGGPTLRVAAKLDSSGTKVSDLRIAPGVLGADKPAAGSPFSIAVLNSAGAVVSQLPVAPRTVHVDGTSGPADLTFSAEVAAPEAHTVQILKDGTVIAERVRTPAAPQVRTVAPKKGTRVGPGGQLRIGWTASDADGDPLSAGVDFSSDGGKSWRPLMTDVEGNSAQVSGSLLQGSKRALIRVRVNDGFNVSAARSKPFRSAGAEPIARILSPTPNARIAADTKLQVAGEAYDDRAQLIPRKRLRWLSGKNVLARGETASIPAAKLRRKLTLAATDRNGKTARKSIRIKVERVAPLFTRLANPKSIARKARRLKLRVASTIPARLAISGKSVAGRKRCKMAKGKRRCKTAPTVARVGTRPRKVPVQIKPGKNALKLSLRLTAGKKTTKHRIRIKRM